MDLISQIPVFGGFLSTILAFTVVISVIVFVHEYGHYIVGRWCGIHAETFSLGFGPVIWARTDRRGTKWQLAAIPMGGYVKFLGDRNPSSETDFAALELMSQADKNRSFPAATVGRRALTVAAGPLANFILASLIFAGLIFYQGVATDTPQVGEVTPLPHAAFDLQVGDEILEVQGKQVSSFGDILRITSEMEAPRSMELLIQRDGIQKVITAPYLLVPVVYSVEPLSAASEAGLEKADVVLSADGVTINTFSDLQTVVRASNNTEILLEVWRDGALLSLPITPEMREYPDGNGGFAEQVMIGVYGSFAFLPASETPPVWKAVYLGGQRTVDVVTTSLNGIKHMFLGNLSPKNLQGPVGIAQISKETANQGLINFFSLIAVISTGIGLLNLFPIPMLDGGHLVFFGVEAIRGQPLAQKTIQSFMSIGLAMVLLLMVFATYNDLMRL